MQSRVEYSLWEVGRVGGNLDEFQVGLVIFNEFNDILRMEARTRVRYHEGTPTQHRHTQLSLTLMYTCLSQHPRIPTSPHPHTSRAVIKACL